MSTKLSLKLAATLTVLGLVACQPGDIGVQTAYSGATMGTQYRVVVVPGDDGRIETLDESIRERLDALDRRFSTYRPNSEVARFNATPGNEWFEVSQDTLEILQHAYRISELTGGAFDITVAPLVDLWGFGPEAPPATIPAQAAVDERLAAVGYLHLELRETPPSLRRGVPNLKIDLSSIAKGYAVDAIGRLLEQRGIGDFMIDIGGEILTRGLSPDGDAWTVAVEHPGGGREFAPSLLELRNTAVATSGDYRNFFEYQGVRYSHAIDPKTGWPIDNGVAAATVVAITAMQADALATAFMVLAPERSLEIAENQAIAAMLQIRDGDEIRILRSSRFDAYVGGSR